MAIYDVTDLDVYNRSLKILRLVYKLAHQIPDTHIRLRNQLLASSESVPPLIAEGFAKRKSSKEFKRFLSMALGSSDETITHAREIYILCTMVKSLSQELCKDVGEEYKVISKQLNSLIKRWTSYN